MKSVEAFSLFSPCNLLTTTVFYYARLELEDPVEIWVLYDLLTTISEAIIQLLQ